MTQPRFRRLFTVEEAKAELDRMRPALERMSYAATRLRDLQTLNADAGEIESGDGFLGVAALDAPDDEEVQRLNRFVRGVGARLQQRGIELKDAARGLIDFPHEMEGEVVFLCWELTDPELAFWHRIEDGYPGRRPIENL